MITKCSLAKKMSALCAAAAAALCLCAPGQAARLEGDLNTFKLSTPMSEFKSMTKVDGEQYLLPFSWDGYELTASLTFSDGKLATAALLGDMDNGLIGMFVADMAKRGYMPIQIEADGKAVNIVEKVVAGKSKDECREFAMDSMGAWAGNGKDALLLLFFPDAAFDAMASALKVNNDSDNILNPYLKLPVYALNLQRDGDKVYFVIGSMGDMMTQGSDAKK